MGNHNLNETLFAKNKQHLNLRIISATNKRRLSTKYNMSAQKMLLSQAARIAELEAELYRSKHQVLVLRQNKNQPSVKQSADSATERKPLAQIGSAFGSIPLQRFQRSAPLNPAFGVKSAPVTPRRAVAPRAALRSLPTSPVPFARKPRSQSQENSRQGLAARRRSPPRKAEGKAYVVDGVEIKTPVSNKPNKYGSVQVSIPDQPRKMSRCWRRGPAKPKTIEG